MVFIANSEDKLFQDEKKNRCIILHIIPMCIVHIHIHYISLAYSITINFHFVVLYMQFFPLESVYVSQELYAVYANHLHKTHTSLVRTTQHIVWIWQENINLTTLQIVLFVTNNITKGYLVKPVAELKRY